jgi:hypothetical protein
MEKEAATHHPKLRCFLRYALTRETRETSLLATLSSAVKYSGGEMLMTLVANGIGGTGLDTLSSLDDSIQLSFQ